MLVALLAELPALQRGADRAARVAAVGAIAEPAARRQRREIRELRPQRGGIRPHLDLAHARIVDEHASAGQCHELARHRRMPTLARHRVHAARLQPLPAEQRIHDRALADPRRTDEGEREAPGRAQQQRRVALATPRDDRMHLRAQGGELRHRAGDVLLRREIRLVEQHERTRPAAADERQVALHAARIVIRPEIRDHHHRVHIRADHLLRRAFAGSLAREPVAARQQRADHRQIRPLPRIDRHPVADRRQIGVRRGVVPQLAAEHRLMLAPALGGDAEIDARLADDARGVPLRALQSLESAGEILAPAEILQSRVHERRRAA